MQSMNWHGKETNLRPSHVGGKDARVRVCATVLAVALCGIPLWPLFAHADNDPSTVGDVQEDIPESELPVNPDDEFGDGTEDGSSSSSSSSSSASEDPIPEPEEPSDVDPPEADDQAPAPESDQETTLPDQQDGNASPDAEAGPVASAPSEQEQKAKSREETQSKLKGKMTKAQQAAELRAQAEAIISQMNRLAAEWDECQVEYDEAQNALERAKTSGKEQRKQLKSAKKRLDDLKERLSKYVVDMYKQGGVTPYLDALFRTTSYREFLSAWYMLDEVSQYGKEELHERIEAVEAAEAKAGAYKERVKGARRVVRETRSRLDRVKLMYLSLAPHVARLNMEAAELEKNASAAAAFKADFEAACAELDAAIASGLKIEGKLAGQGIFNHPCPGAEYSSGFGYRSFDHAYHLGLDMAIGEGTPYYAADDGVVIDATSDGGYNGGAGNWIVIEHDGGLVTKYMHSLSTFVRPGDRVVRGQAIGLVGNTGNSFGAHLHFQVEIGGTAVDPIIYL